MARNRCTMRIGVVSDTHDRVEVIADAIRLLVDQRVELILHCGDIPFKRPRFSSKTMPGSDVAAQANFSYRAPANIDHFPPYECPTTPIRLASTYGKLASAA